MTETLTFNTGRHYSPKGQNIEVKVTERKEDAFGPFARAHFADHTRGVYGEILLNDGELTQDAVMRAYDEGRYLCVAPFSLYDPQS